MGQATISIAIDAGTTPAQRVLLAVAPGAPPVYVLIVAAIAVTAASMARRGLSLIGADFAVLGTAATLLMLVGLCLRTRGWGSIATLIETWTLMGVYCIVVTLLLFAIGAGGAPLADGAFAGIDRTLAPGFDWPATMRALASHRWVMAAANACYASLGWQPAALLVACTASGRADGCWTFLGAWMVALLIVAAVFAVAPGLGAYAYYGVAAAEVPAMHDPTPWVQPAILAALRDGSLRTIAFAGLEGIVTFPSFHAAAAVLLGWGFWPLRRLRVPMASLNAAMLVAAVPVGGHYLIDIPAGMTVATIAIFVARRWSAEHAGEDRVDVLEVVVEVEARGDLVRG